MSRHNKVNPGMYTQRGRLTQDDAARELAKQRNVGSPHTWQPVQRDKMPAMFEDAEQDEVKHDEQAAKPAQPVKKTPARVKAKVASTTRKPAKIAARKTGTRKPAVRRTAPAKKARTAAKRGKAKSATPVSAKGKAKSTKRRKS
jgi:hypothetical protein